MGFVTARGVRCHVVDLPCRRPALLGAPLEPVVMLHGLFTGSAASWYLTAARSLAAERPIRLIDWRGHGRSERPRSGYGARALADDLAEITADLPPFAIVSHSYGGLAALRFMLARPERVRRAVLVEPPLDAATAGATAEERARAAASAVDPAIVSAGDPNWLTGGLSAAATQRLADLVNGTTIRHDLAAEPPVTDLDLLRLPLCPLMVVVGADSPFRATADRLRAARPDVATVVLPGGHDIHRTQHRAVAALLLDFLTGAR
jgi:pimeloyl-ACP methyl ester carboxylesterase